MRYDPRAVTGIPTEPVGSLPRPQALLDAFAGYDAGRIDDAVLDAAADTAVADTIAQFAATGSPLISDGEQRRGSFATYPAADPRTGLGTAPALDAAGRYLSIFADGHGRGLSTLSGEPFRYRSYAGDTLSRSVGHTTVPLKQAVISPSMVALLYPHPTGLPDYPWDRFESDLVDECERDIRSAFAAGAVRVSIDFADGRLAGTVLRPGRDDSGPVHAVEPLDAVMDRFTALERTSIGVHVCMGPDHGPDHHPDPAARPYPDIVADVLQIDAGYFLFQLAATRDRDAVCAAIGKHLRTDAAGVSPIAHVGVVNPYSPRVESAREVADTLVRAAAHIPAEQLGSTDDCGFSPFACGPQPVRGLPDVARAIAFRKIRSRVEGTYLAAEEVGIA